MPSLAPVIRQSTSYTPRDKCKVAKSDYLSEPTEPVVLTKQNGTFDFRVDLIQKVLSLDEETRTVGFLLKPDPRRYEECRASNQSSETTFLTNTVQATP